MKQMHILDQMKPEEVAELKAQSVTKTFQRREIIFHKEDTPKYLYVLLEGAVAEVYLFIDEKLPFSAEAMKKSTVLMIPRSVLHRFPQISRNLNVMLSQKAYTLSQKLKLLMKDSLREKIMEYMQQHPDVLLKRHELASFLGVSRPALSRELYRMVDDGLLVLDEHGSFKTVI